ncbi:MAG: hypothetical protein H7831_16675 [Magnetococcus sp. WYHC-3]
MSISSLNNWTGGRAKAAEGRIMNRVKRESGRTQNALQSEHMQAEVTVSNSVRGVVRETMSLQINREELKAGAVYPAPRPKPL